MIGHGERPWQCLGAGIRPTIPSRRGILIVILSELYRRTSDLPDQVPVFPLRGTILLPRAVLPLNIFEPRYLAMLDEVISGNRLLGIVQPDRGGDLFEEDDEAVDVPEDDEVSLRKVGCLGRVTGFQELDDGRLMITLTGVARFRIVGEPVSGRPFRICKIDCEEFAGDLDEGLGEEGVDRETLLRVLKTYLSTRNLEADWHAITKASTEFLVNSLSVVSPYGPEEKQALLEADDLKSRAEVLVALAEMELASGGEGSGGGGSTLQ